MRVSVIVPAFNEQQNIAPLLRRIAGERYGGSAFDDIVVVASGCTDRTVEEATAVQQVTPAIRLLVQEQREGKASAINLGLRAAAHDAVVLVSGDVMPAAGAIGALLRRLEDPEVGVVGGRPVPMNDESTFIGFACNLLWRLHHVISESTPENPKCGEMIAFRRRVGERWLVPAIPVDSAVDEVSIQSLIHQAGLRSCYEREAIVQTWGPSTLGDWFIQRRRINAGHIVSARQGFTPSTMSVRTILKAFARDPLARRRPLWVAATIFLEGLARAAGRFDLARGQGHTVWRVANSTKRAIELRPIQGADGQEDTIVPAEVPEPFVIARNGAGGGVQPVGAVAIAASSEPREAEVQ